MKPDCLFGPLLSGLQTGTSSGSLLLPFPLLGMPFPASPHGLAMNKAMCVQVPASCPSPSLVPSLWQRPGFHTPLSQLHEAHASPQALPELWFSQEFQCQPGAAPRCAGRQGKQEVSSWPGHRQQARWALSGHRLH